MNVQATKCYRPSVSLSLSVLRGYFPNNGIAFKSISYTEIIMCECLYVGYRLHALNVDSVNFVTLMLVLTVFLLNKISFETCLHATFKQTLAET